MDKKLMSLGPDMFLLEENVMVERNAMPEHQGKMIFSAIDDYINGGSVDELSSKLDQLSDQDDSCEHTSHWLN